MSHIREALRVQGRDLELGHSTQLQICQNQRTSLAFFGILVFSPDLSPNKPLSRNQWYAFKGGFLFLGCSRIFPVIPVEVCISGHEKAKGLKLKRLNGLNGDPLHGIGTDGISPTEKD